MNHLYGRTYPHLTWAFLGYTLHGHSLGIPYMGIPWVYLIWAFLGYTSYGHSLGIPYMGMLYHSDCRLLQGHMGSVDHIAFDGKIIVSAGADW